MNKMLGSAGSRLPRHADSTCLVDHASRHGFRHVKHSVPGGRPRLCSARYSSASQVQEYLQTSLGIDGELYRELAANYSAIDTLSVEDSVAPVVALFRQYSTQQRIRKLLRRSPEILASPLEAWQEFLSGYGFTKAGFVKLLESTPELFSSTSLFEAGTLIAHLKAMGLEDNIIVSVVLRYPQLLALDLHNQILPVLNFLYDLGCSEACVRDLISRSPRVLSRSVTDDLQAKVDYFINTLAFSKQQLLELAEADPGFLATDLHADTKPKLNFLQSLGLTTAQVQQVLAADPHMLANALPNLQRKWRYLQTVVGGSVQDIVAYPGFFSHNLLLVIGPRYSLVWQHNLAAIFSKQGSGDSSSSGDYSTTCHDSASSDDSPSSSAGTNSSSSGSSSGSSTFHNTKARLSEALELKQQSNMWFDARHDAHLHLQQAQHRAAPADSSSPGISAHIRPDLALLLGCSNADFATKVGLSSEEWQEFITEWVQTDGLQWSGVNAVYNRG